MPNSLSLDEALSGVSMKPKADVLNVSTNSRRVSSYLRQLDKYILVRVKMYTSFAAIDVTSNVAAYTLGRTRFHAFARRPR